MFIFVSNPFSFARVLLLVGLTMVSIGCGAQTPKRTWKPQIAVMIPPDGARFDVDETIIVEIGAVSSDKIARVELRMNDGSDKLLAQRENSPPNIALSTNLIFKPETQGRIRLTAYAFDANGNRSDPFNFSVIVGDENATPVSSVSSSQPLNSEVTHNGCKLSSRFVQDMNVPDGTIVGAGTTFTKTWRMQNSSVCDWEAGFALAFFEDTQMGSTTNVPLPKIPDGAIFDINVELTAPNASGLYTSTWRMKAPNGQTFGNRVYAVIRVP
jgi:hypothetical protein